MPTSLLAAAPAIVHLVETAPGGRRILDIGPGHGKYGLLLREYLNRKPERLVAVEAHRPYLEEWGGRLAAIYDDVVEADGLDLGSPDPLPVRMTARENRVFGSAVLPVDFLEGFDLLLLVDVIEHFEKDRALELLDRFPGRVVISTPRDFFVSVPGHPTEEHVSHWTREDFDAIPGRAVELDSSAMGGIWLRLGPRS